jgi:hypothetical protein
VRVAHGRVARQKLFSTIHCKKGFAVFPSPPRESLISDIPARDGKIANLFYSVGVLYITSSRAVPTPVAGIVKRMIRLLLAEISGCFLPVVHSVCAGLLGGGFCSPGLPELDHLYQSSPTCTSPPDNTPPPPHPPMLKGLPREIL